MKKSIMNKQISELGKKTQGLNLQINELLDNFCKENHAKMFFLGRSEMEQGGNKENVMKHINFFFIVDGCAMDKKERQEVVRDFKKLGVEVK